MRINKYIETYEDELIIAFENQTKYDKFLPFVQAAYQGYIDEMTQQEGLHWEIERLGAMCKA